MTNDSSPGAHIPPEIVRKHAEQLAAGLIPEDSPPDFILPQDVTPNGLPWWFPPNFKADFPVGFGAPQRGDQVTRSQDPVTRASIEAEFNYRVASIRKPVPVQPPKRMFTAKEMADLRLGYTAQVMEEKWHAFMEEDQLILCRSWTGFTLYEAVMSETAGGWVVAEALGESDAAPYLFRSPERSW